MEQASSVPQLHLSLVTNSEFLQGSQQLSTNTFAGTGGCEINSHIPTLLLYSWDLPSEAENSRCLLSEFLLQLEEDIFANNTRGKFAEDLWK